MKDQNIFVKGHKKQKLRPISKHMQSFGDRYNPATKILKTQNGEQLQKYAHGYFPINKLNRKRITKEIKKILESYPQWILEQKQFDTKDFSYCFSKMVEAHPFLLKLNQKPGPNQASFLKTIDHIRFPYLTQIQINLQHSVNLQSFGWMQCHSLQSIMISSSSILSSLNPFAKTNFKSLKILRLEINELKNSDKRNYDLTKISRIKMKNKTKNLKGTFYFDINQGIINFLRRDVSDIYALAKIQMGDLQNFRIPQIIPKLGKNSLRIQNTIKVINKKFNNQTTFYRLLEHTNNHFIDDIYDTGQLHFMEQRYDDFLDQQSYVGSDNQLSENSQNDN